MKWFVYCVKNYAKFSGRARRQEYWMYVLFYIIFGIAAGVVDTVLGTNDPDTGVGMISGLYSLVLLIPSLAVAARRLHDSGKSGFWLLLAFIPLVGFVVLLIFMLLDSEPGANKYGPNPKEAAFA